jgi:hypothetical protein
MSIENKSELPFHEGLQCHVRHLEYDFQTRKGRLVVDHESCPDMTACIALFGAIDPHVNFIEVFAGDIPDVAYVKSDADGKWSAEEPYPL